MARETEGTGIDQDEMIALVRQILDGADLSQTTGKIVRQKVLDELGERAGPDMRALKRSIRNALSVVLSGQTGSSGSSSRPSQPPELKDKAEPKDKASGQEPKEEVDNGRNGAAPDKSAVDAAGGSGALPSLGPVDASEHDADDEDEDGSVPVEEAKARRMSGKKRRSRSVVHEEDDEDDDDFNPDMGATNPSPSRLTKMSDLTPSPSRPRMCSEITPSPSLPKHSYDITPSPSRPKMPGISSSPSPARPVKRSRSQLLTSEKHLEKLRSVCKQLGCMAPPSRMRGKTVPEKCAAVVEYLLQKGVDVPNPTLLTRKEIAVHRARLEQEKELAGLDTRCVCRCLMFIDPSRWLHYGLLTDSMFAITITPSDLFSTLVLAVVLSFLIVLAIVQQHY